MKTCPGGETCHVWKPAHSQPHRILGESHPVEWPAGWWETVITPLGDGDLESIRYIGEGPVYCFPSHAELLPDGEAREMVPLERAVDAVVEWFILTDGAFGCCKHCYLDRADCGSPACREALRSHLREEAAKRG